MSAKIDVLFTQRVLSCGGFNPGRLDGEWGPKTDSAYQRSLQSYQQIALELGTFDQRSEINIASLLPLAQRKVRSFLHLMAGRRLACRILSGTRTYAQQDALYHHRPKVTNARGGQSNHNFGIAWDIGLFDGGRYMTGGKAGDDAAYAEAARIAKALPGLEWGGDWASFKDAPHYQLATGKPLSAIRALFEAGKPFV